MHHRFSVDSKSAKSYLFGVLTSGPSPRSTCGSIITMDFLSCFALGLILFVILILAYGMIAIHDIPYHIAKGRQHPH